MNIFNVIALIGGISLFQYGMKIMGDGLKKGSSETLKRAMEKVTNNPIKGFLLGVLVTAIIQSSKATIVLTSGLVGAGIITLHQSLGIILGANVGTTVTGQIIRLLDVDSSGTAWLELFKPSTLAPIAAFIGILMIMFIKTRNSDTIGTIAMGFAILFTGLLNMTSSVSGLAGEPWFTSLLTRFASSPILGYLAGAIAAFGIQSSSATVGILQALSVTGQLTFNSIYCIIIGIYIGDAATTGLMCAIGAKADAKRTGVINIIFNLCSTVVIIVGVILCKRFGFLANFWNAPITSGGIANTHTIFKLASSLLLLPACISFEKLSHRIVKDDPEEQANYNPELEALDKAFLNSPALALSASKNVIASMASLACGNVTDAMGLLESYDEKDAALMTDDEDYIDSLTDHVSDYMMKLSPNVLTGDTSDQLNYYIKCVSEFERIGDYAVNILESAQELVQKETVFSDQAKQELKVMSDILTEIMNHTKTAFMQLDSAAAKHIEPLEEVVDDMVADLRENHLRRLREGKCSIIAGFTFLDVLVNIERISDQCSNIGVYTISLFDHSIQEHDYIDQLHKGLDAAYEAEFASVREKYFGMLSAIEAAD